MIHPGRASQAPATCGNLVFLTPSNYRDRSIHHKFYIYVIMCIYIYIIYLYVCVYIYIYTAYIYSIYIYVFIIIIYYYYLLYIIVMQKSCGNQLTDLPKCRSTTITTCLLRPPSSCWAVFEFPCSSLLPKGLSAKAQDEIYRMACTMWVPLAISWFIKAL